MTELRIRLKGRELDYAYRHRAQLFTAPDDTQIGALVRARFIWALENLHLDQQPRKTHQKQTPAPDAPPTDLDPYADEPDEDA